MAETLKHLAQTLATDSGATAYTVPSATGTLIKEMSFCNVGSSATTFSLRLVRSGAETSNAQYLYKDVPLEVGDTADVPCFRFLDTGDSLVVAAGTTLAVAFNAWGVELT